MKRIMAFGCLAVCTLLAGCSHSSGDDTVQIGTSTDMKNGHIRLSNDQVTLRVDGAPDATIGAGGDLQINQQAVAVNDAQRQLLKSYYQNAYAIRTDGIATGKAGAAVGAQALKSVAARLASGNPDQIQKDIDAKTTLVKQAAAKICQDINGIKTAQNQLTAQLPAFTPYGNIVASDDGSHCEEGLKD